MMNRKFEKTTICSLCLGIIVLFCINIGCAAAADVTLQMPETVPSVGDTVRIPVILHTDVPISLFSFTVNNTVPHAVIMVQKSDALEGSYTINSTSDASEQYISWYTLTDVFQNNLNIAEIVVTTEPGVLETIPITISNLKIGDAALNNIANPSSVSSPSLLSISGGSPLPQTSSLPTQVPVTPDAGAVDAEKDANIPVSTSESLKTDTEASESDLSDSLAVVVTQNPDNTPSVQLTNEPDIQVQTTPVSTPIGFIPAAAGLFAAFGVIMFRKRRGLL